MKNYIPALYFAAAILSFASVATRPGYTLNVVLGIIAGVLFLVAGAKALRELRKAKKTSR